MPHTIYEQWRGLSQPINPVASLPYCPLFPYHMGELPHGVKGFSERLAVSLSDYVPEEPHTYPNHAITYPILFQGVVRG